MATLTGNITDVTSKIPENISSITVKAPAARIGGGTDVIVSSPATVDFNSSTGDITISGLAGGLSWLYIEGDGWSDSIPLAVAEGMLTLVEAVANAAGIPGMVEYFQLMTEFRTRIDDIARDAVDDLIDWEKGVVSTSVTSIDDLDSGLWDVRSVTVAQTLGLPTVSIGRLEILKGWQPKAARWTPTFASSSVDPEPEVWIAQTNGSGEWSRWEKITGNASKELPNPVDFNEVKRAGMYHRPRSRTNDLNAPTNALGSLWVTDLNHPSGEVFTQMYMAYWDFGIYFRSSNTSGVWTRWFRLDGGGGDSFGSGALSRDAVVSAGLAKRGGGIGTAGKGAVSLRFSHHTRFFEQKILPLLKKYRLPWAQVLNPGNYMTGNDTMPYEAMAEAVHSTGGEIWDHGRTHSNFNTEAEADVELGTSLEELRAELPSIYIDCFAAYGSGDMMGLKGWDAVEKFQTYGAKILLSKYFIINGLFPGQVRALNGPDLIGSPYAPLDRLSVSQAKNRIDLARDTAGGVMFMLHPNYLDQEGYITTAQLDEVLGYIASERDAGRIRVLSTAGRLIADASASDRNLLKTGAAGTVAGSWSEGLSGLNAPTSYGVPHEAEAWVKGTGEVTLKVVVDSPTRPLSVEHKVTLSGESQRLSVPITPPLDTTSTVVSLTGNVRHTGVKYRPI